MSQSYSEPVDTPSSHGEYKATGVPRWITIEYQCVIQCPERFWPGPVKRTLHLTPPDPARFPPRARRTSPRVPLAAGFRPSDWPAHAGWRDLSSRVTPERFRIIRLTLWQFCISHPAREPRRPGGMNPGRSATPTWTVSQPNHPRPLAGLRAWLIVSGMEQPSLLGSRP